MPRPEQTPTPAFERGSELPQGTASQLNELASFIPGEAVFAEEADFDEGDDEETFTPESDEDEFLFSPSDRPGEPITAGAPFGPGANAVRGQFETDQDFLARIASTLGDADAVVKGLLDRIQRGE